MLCRTLIVSACVLLLSGCQSTGGTKILVNGKPFKEVDVNNDGGISEQEFLGDRKKAFNIMDINGDEHLVFSEYQTVMMIPHQVKMAERRKDAQGDPVILKLVEKMEETYPKVIEEKFSKLDKNKDKKITYEEYQVSVKKIVENFMSADFDEDNLVSEKELQTNMHLKIMKMRNDTREMIKKMTEKGSAK